MPLRRPFAETVIYELHVRGFTRHPSSGVAAGKRGTYAGLIEKIPVPEGSGRHRRRAAAGVSVRSAGCARRPRRTTGATSRSRSSRRITRTARAAIRSACSTSSATWSRRCTAPASKSSSTSSSTTPPKAARTGRRCAIAASPTTSTTSSTTDKSRYADYTGCGNTLNANQPIVRRLIQDSLRYWVTEMHVDGFRFDLASILSRDEAGRPLPNPPVLWDIESDPLLAGTKLIAEAWDAAGLYQVGSFVGDAWQEWNGRFRDDVRRFLKGDNGYGVAAWRRGCSAAPTSTATRNARPSRASTSSPATTASRSNDLVSYNDKHNEANGEDNRDGADDNLSWNCGVEGPDRRSGDRGAAQPAGQELPRAGAAGGRHADAADGRRSAPDAARQQQRLLPGQRDQLVRLDACSSGTPTSTGSCKLLNAFRQRRDVVVEGAALTLNQLLRPGAQSSGTASRSNRPDWSEHSHSLAFTLRSLRGALSPPRHAQRLLGAADVRAAAVARGCAAALAALHRHGARLARRHLPLGASADRRQATLRRAAALGCPSRARVEPAAEDGSHGERNHGDSSRTPRTEPHGLDRSKSWR